jgi:hypothetical protein
MTAKEILNRVLNTNYLIIEDNQLQSALDNSEIIRVEDTHLSDFIRILKHEDKIIVQEITFKKEIIIRKAKSIEDAQKFVQDRLDFYERKWDGCGCNIDYYE